MVPGLTIIRRRWLILQKRQSEDSVHRVPLKVLTPGESLRCYASGILVFQIEYYLNCLINANFLKSNSRKSTTTTSRPVTLNFERPRQNDENHRRWNCGNYDCDPNAEQSIVGPDIELIRHQYGGNE